MLYGEEMQNPYQDDQEEAEELNEEDMFQVEMYPSDLLKTLRYMLTIRFLSTEWLYKNYDIN